MALMTGAQYIESLRKLNTKVYMFGEEVKNWVDHPMIRPSINCVAATYDLAHDPEYADLMTVTSNITGEKINRFGHLHQSVDDLIKKVKMQRLCGQKTASCFQRCVGMDAFNAVYSTTFECDKAHGTNYHDNFVKYLTYIQENDLVVDGAMTDPKGDRSLSPSAQPDPDMFLHIVERREDGIIVRGAKAHQTGSINSHEHLIMPTISMTEADKDYAVSFAVPSDAEGVFMIYGRQSCDTRKLEEGADVDLGNKEFGGQEALVVFDNVFVPNDRIFLCGEWDFSGMLVERFAGYHRQSYGGCKVGVGDVIIGAAALAADYNGANKASHIKDKLMVTMPSEKDFKSDLKVGTSGMTIGEVCNKYFKASSVASTEERMRILRFLENICLGSSAVGYRTESMHGAGSPQAQRIMISRQGNINQKKELAKKIAGIKKEEALNL